VPLPSLQQAAHNTAIHYIDRRHLSPSLWILALTSVRTAGCFPISGQTLGSIVAFHRSTGLAAHYSSRLGVFTAFRILCILEGLTSCQNSNTYRPSRRLLHDTSV